MGIMVSMTSMAQEEDVTSYIKNAGFDEDLTWQADGSKKEIVDQSTVLSNRSIAGLAADGSRYALVNPSTPNKRKVEPERTLEATNGFIGVIDGWEVVYPNDDVANSKKCEWLYFGNVPYALGETAIPVADDGDTYLTVPEKPADIAGDDNVGMLYLRAGWTNACSYKQVVNLPCAKYRLEYWTININTNSTAQAEDLSKITCRRDVFKDETGTGLSSTEWVKHEFEFTPTSEFTIEFGFKAANAGSGANPIVCLDGIKLYKIGEADRGQLLMSDLIDIQNDLTTLQEQANGLGYYGLVNEMDEYIAYIDDEMPTDDDALEAFLKKVKEDYNGFVAALELIPEVESAIAQVDRILTTTDYPGKAALQAMYDKLLDYKNKGTKKDLEGAKAEATAAILAYVKSQEASEASPANYTYFVLNPWFIKPEFEPVYEDGMWIYPNGDTYNAGSTNDDQVSDGWFKSGAYQDGDQRLNFAQGRTCWNAWGSGFTTTIGVAQDLTGLPNGYYTVSADLITQPGMATDQHVFATSPAQTVISDYLPSGDWNEDNTGEWTTLTTKEKVLVSDGTLRIGAEGTGTGDGAAGWFCVTNFRLNYLGEAGADALQQLFDAKISQCELFAANMHFAADKAAFEKVISENKNATDLSAALTAVNAAQAEAQTSEAKYEEYMMEGKTIPTVKAKLEGEGYKAATEIVKFAYDYVTTWMACDTASYKDLDTNLNLLKNYLNNYTPVYNAADSIAALSTETAKAYLSGIMAEQKKQLVAKMQTAETVNELVEALKLAMGMVEKQNIIDDANATDFTAFIINPNAESETGWMFERGNGDKNTTSGQWYDGSNTRYFDSYNAGGLVGFKACQVITDLPNGTYTVGVYTRTPAEGAYIFYAKNDTTFVEIPLDYYTDDEGEQQVASDKFGPIWENAKNAVEGGSDNETVLAIYNANSGQGRGWKHQEIAGIEVTDHRLCIGTLAGSESHLTEKTFSGNWYSVGGWTLTMTAKGDNSGWTGPLADGIETVTTAGQLTNDGIYSSNGVRLQHMQRGLNIIVRDGKATKLMVK